VSLPSEGEWERAAHGIDVQSYPWSGPLTPLKANYAATSRLAPSRVGEFDASVDGLADMAGNVAEWTRSEYQSYPYDPDDGRESLTTDPAARVIRGGSFFDGPSLLRTTSRQAADPHRGYNYVGFRVVLTSAVRPSAPAQQGAQVQQRPPAPTPPGAQVQQRPPAPTPPGTQVQQRPPAPTPQGATVPQGAPVPQDAPAQQDAPAPQDALAQQDAAVPQDAPAQQGATVQERPPAPTPSTATSSKPPPPKQPAPTRRRRGSVVGT
jgi:hypothetical protein